jgi:hypothetical protein
VKCFGVYLEKLCYVDGESPLYRMFYKARQSPTLPHEHKNTCISYASNAKSSDDGS